MRSSPCTYALVRIIGNDLPPRHRAGQSLENLRFILEHEPDFPKCQKLWLVNRIFDPQEEALIIETLESAGQDYLRLSFQQDAYARTPLNFSRFPPQYIHLQDYADLGEAEQIRAVSQIYRAKNNYVMNNNGARNAALDWGRTRAKWIMPWDGNCFLTQSDWARLVADIAAQEYRRYFVVPMARLGSNEAAFDTMEPSNAVEEPQIVFRRDAQERFDENHPYGRRPKVELLARLGVPGPWYGWSVDPWDIPAAEVVPDSHRVGRAGMVRRLASGRADLEGETRRALHGRGFARNQAINATLRSLDKALLEDRGFDPGRTAFFDTGAIDRLTREPSQPFAKIVRQAAGEALQRGPFSVVDKTELPPSGNRHDYLHPAPYWWPNPRTRDGLPYVWRDGVRLPGTVMYAPESDKYDRTRLQLMVDDTISCSLAWAAFGDTRSRDHARLLVETWFLADSSAMTPHLRYAQIRRGHSKNEGNSTGIIEFKDLSYLLDAVRLIDDPDLSERLAGWLRTYRDWLVTSPQGVGERRALNNHGLFYDLQLAAISAFLGDLDTLLDCYLASTARLAGHFDGMGAQPHELSRSLAKHYCAFNLQGWLSLYQIYRTCGFPMEHQPDFDRLRTGVEWFLALGGKAWPSEQISEFDEDRFAPIAIFAASFGFGTGTSEHDWSIAVSKPQFHPNDGVPPYWPLMLDPALPISSRSGARATVQGWEETEDSGV